MKGSISLGDPMLEPSCTIQHGREDKGVETGFVDEGHLLFSARGGGVTFGYIPTSSTTIDEAVFYRVVRRGHVQNLSLLATKGE